MCYHHYLQERLISNIGLNYSKSTSIESDDGKDSESDGESESDDDAKNVGASSLAI